jgi:hypothetical protein
MNCAQFAASHNNNPLNSSGRSGKRAGLRSVEPDGGDGVPVPLILSERHPLKI